MSGCSFTKNVLNPLSAPRADLALLICCMKLVVWTPSGVADEKDHQDNGLLDLEAISS
jgi:hypothetical protein